METIESYGIGVPYSWWLLHQFVLLQYTRSMESSCCVALLGGLLIFVCLYLTQGRWASTCQVSSVPLTATLPSCCLWPLRIFTYFPPVLAYDLLSRCEFSTLTPRQPMVEFYLTHVFTLTATEVRIKDLLLSRIELTTPHYYSDLSGTACT